MNSSFNVYVAKAFDYLSAETFYKVSQEGKNDMHFKNLKTGGRTTLYKWEVEQALCKGWMIKQHIEEV